MNSQQTLSNLSILVLLQNEDWPGYVLWCVGVQPLGGSKSSIELNICIPGENIIAAELVHGECLHLCRPSSNDDGWYAGQ